MHVPGASKGLNVCVCIVATEGIADCAVIYDLFSQHSAILSVIA